MVPTEINQNHKVEIQYEKILQAAIRSNKQRQNELSTMKVLLTTLILDSDDHLQIKIWFEETEVSKWSI